MKDSVLLIGINTYPGAPLNGCVPDIKAWCDRLVGGELEARGRDFKIDSNFAACTDERAHAMGYRERLARLVLDAKPGDRILFAYSGHGAQVPVRDGMGEVDNEMEVLCPHDFTFDDQDTWITDVDFIDVFSQVPEGVNCTIVLDSCFSGGMFAGAAKNRALEHPLRNRAFPLAGLVDYDVRKAAARARGVGVRKVIDRAALKNVAVIEGCQESQTCADAWLGVGYQGALTYYLLQALFDDLDRPLTETVAATAGKIKAAGFEQVPMVTGPELILSKPFGTRL
jgi:metacaspase-1